MTTATLTADPAGRRATLRTTTSLLRPVTLSCDAASARVALVPEGALLLAGDHVAIEVRVGPGAHLEVVETSGTVAYDMRGGTASWSLDVRVAEGGSLVWQGLPFVAAAGADVRRRTVVDLAHDARLLLRETLVLGRVGESPGRVHTSTTVGHVLVEELEPDVLPCRVLDSILAVGHPPTAGAMTLHTGDHLYRSLSDATHDTGLDATWHSLRPAHGG